MSTTAGLLRQVAPAAAESATLCGRCHAPVLITVGTDLKRRVLTPVLVPGGLYQLDQDGRAVRRRGSDMAAEYRHGRALRGGGFEPHSCARPRS